MAGELIAMKAEVVGQGKTLAFTRVEIESVKTGKLLAYGEEFSLSLEFLFRRFPSPTIANFDFVLGSHTKYIASALKGDKNVTFSEDGETQLTGAEC